MCSWCYGFTNEFAAVLNHFNEYNLEMVMGGLRPYDKRTMNEFKDYLSTGWKNVSERTGMPFSFDILDNNTITYATEPPSRATVVVRELAPAKEFDFYKEVQRLFYSENKNMHLKESYHSVLKNMNISTEKFDELFTSEEFKQRVKKDFERARSLSVSSFPTMLLYHENEYFMVAQGYREADHLIDTINSITQKKQTGGQ